MAAYGSATLYKAWADARGYTYGSDALINTALLRASEYVDAKYGDAFEGLKAGGRDQERQWPRSGACDREGYGFTSTEVPQALLNAVYEAAKRELASTGSLAPDVKAGGGVATRVKAGSVEVEFANTGTTYPSFPAIDAALSSLLIVRSPYSGRVVRG